MDLGPLAVFHMEMDCRKAVVRLGGDLVDRVNALELFVQGRDVRRDDFQERKCRCLEDFVGIQSFIAGHAGRSFLNIHLSS